MSEKKKHNPIMIIGALIAGVSLAMWIGWPLFMPTPAPGWPLYGVIIGAIVLIAGFFIRP